jgi:DNA-binding transcriptional LysR family regulator
VHEHWLSPKGVGFQCVAGSISAPAICKPHDFRTLSSRAVVRNNRLNVLPGNEAVREAVEAGAGATIISRHVVASAIAAGTLVEIPIELPQREFALVRHRERHATLAQKALVAHLTGDIVGDLTAAVAQN